MKQKQTIMALTLALLLFNGCTKTTTVDSVISSNIAHKLQKLDKKVNQPVEIKELESLLLDKNIFIRRGFTYNEEYIPQGTITYYDFNILNNLQKEGIIKALNDRTGNVVFVFK